MFLVIIRDRTTAESGPWKSYLKSGETSIRPAALRKAKYSGSWLVLYERTAWYPAQSFQKLLEQSSAVREWKGLGIGMMDWTIDRNRHQSNLILLQSVDSVIPANGRYWRDSRDPDLIADLLNPAPLFDGV